MSNVLRTIRRAQERAILRGYIEAPPQTIHPKDPSWRIALFLALTAGVALVAIGLVALGALP